MTYSHMANATLPSAHYGFTSEFGKGSGGSHVLWSPDKLVKLLVCSLNFSLLIDPLKSPTPTVDRDRTVSRRSKPSSRTSLNGEQPYPWDLLQPQDEMSRHRGAKHRRRYELLGGISLLSPEYLLSVERWPFHTEPPDH